MNAPVRVLRVIARLNVGGPAQHVQWLAQGLVHHGYRTLLAHGQVGEGESPFEPAPGAPGLERVLVPGLGRAVRPADDLRALAHLVRLCRRHRPRIVHTHTAKAGTLGRIAAAIAGVPLVVHTFHGHVLQGYFGPLVSTLIRAVERSLAARTDAIIALSERQRRDLAWRHRVAPARRIHVVPLGIDLAPLREVAASRQRPGGAPQAAALRRRLGVPARAPLLGWIGRLVPIKRIDRALEAFARLVPALGAHLVVAGGGPERERLDALARTLGVRERVHALGVCLPVAPLYAALDALLVSSDQEGTPVVILEALGAGVPVVATAVGGIPDLAAAAPGAVALAPPEVEALATVLGGVLADRSRRAAMARAGRAAAAQFDLERLCERTAALYATLLSRTRGHAARRRRCAGER